MKVATTAILLKTCLLGFLTTFGLAIVPFNYCICGPGYGRPLPFLFPSHEFLTVDDVGWLGRITGLGDYTLDYTMLVFDIVLWSALVFIGTISVTSRTRELDPRREENKHRAQDTGLNKRFFLLRSIERTGSSYARTVLWLLTGALAIIVAIQLSLLLVAFGPAGLILLLLPTESSVSLSIVAFTLLFYRRGKRLLLLWRSAKM